jgi:hypothetical protein
MTMGVSIKTLGIDRLDVDERLALVEEISLRFDTVVKRIARNAANHPLPTRDRPGR